MSDLLEGCGEQLTKAWDLPDIPAERISSSHPSSSSELAEIFGRSDDDDEELEAFGGSQETQLTSTGLLQQASVASMAELLADSKVSLNSAQQPTSEKSLDEPRRRSARLQSASKIELAPARADVPNVTPNVNAQTKLDEPSRPQTESGSEEIYSEGSDGGHKSASEDDENSDGEGDDPDKLWCICRKPHGDRFMICCDQCEEWYHGDCVGISVAQGKRMERYGEDYVCDLCRENERFKKEERSKMRSERVEKRSQTKSKELEVGGLFVPDNLPKGHIVVDVKPKRPAADESTSPIMRKPRTLSSGGGVGRCVQCHGTVEPPAVLCSNDCIQKHLKTSLDLLTQKGMPEQEGVAVVDKLAGRVMVGGAAPKRSALFEWLQSHRSYQIHLPSRRVSSTNREKMVDAVPGQTKDPDSVRENAKKLLAQALWHRCDTAADDIKNVTSKDQVEKLASQIEEALYALHNDITTKYRTKYRSLLFNLRDPKNQGLFQKVVRGELPTGKLVTLTSEQLASEELRQWRQQEIKKHLEKIKEREEEINRDNSSMKRKITYKGEIEIEATEKEQALSSERPQAAPVVSPLSTVTSPGLPNTTSQHGSHTFDVHCDICQGKLVTTSTVPVKAIVPNEKITPMEVDKPKRLEEYSSKPLSISKWKGLISMPTFTKFVATARGLSGAADHMLEVLPDMLNVEGRIRFNDVWEYLNKLQVSSSRDISVICFESVKEADDQASYIALLDYLVGRDRCGVVALGVREIKDFYLVPLISGSPIPKYLPAETKKRLSSEQREDVLLGVIVHSKALLGSSNKSRHHHKHKRAHHTRDTHDHTQQQQQQQYKKLKMEVGIGSVIPPLSPKKPPSNTPTLEDNGIPSTNIKHFGAGLNSVGLNSTNSEELGNDVNETSNSVVDDDGAYSPSDNVVEKSTTTITSNTDTLTAATSTLTTTDDVIAPALSPNTMSKLQSLIETVKESIAAMPSSVKQEEPAANEEPPPLKEEEKDDSTKSAYVFHETLPPNVNIPITTVTMTATASSVVSQQPVSGFYGNPDVHPHQALYGSGESSQFDHHGYQEPKRHWPPYKGKWSPNGR